MSDEMDKMADQVVDAAKGFIKRALVASEARLDKTLQRLSALEKKLEALEQKSLQGRNR